MPPVQARHPYFGLRVDRDAFVDVHAGKGQRPTRIPPCNSTCGLREEWPEKSAMNLGAQNCGDHPDAEQTGARTKKAEQIGAMTLTADFSEFSTSDAPAPEKHQSRHLPRVVSSTVGTRHHLCAFPNVQHDGGMATSFAGK